MLQKCWSMSGDRRVSRLLVVLLVALAALSGAVGWSGDMWLLPASLVLPLVWSKAPSRNVAGLVAAAYFLAASRGLPSGVATFFSADLWVGLLFWIAASAGFVLIHAAAWARDGRARVSRYAIAAIMLAVPPFGIVGWAHPVTAAGILFPGWGWYGLAATLGAMLALVTRIGPVVLVALLALSGLSVLPSSPLPHAEGWQGIDLSMGANLGRDLSLRHQLALISTITDTAGGDRAIIVLPESTLGFWTPTLERVWTQHLAGSDITVIAGGALVVADGYDSVMVSISADGADTVYRARMPVPVSMWRPWARWLGAVGGARANLSSNGVSEVAGVRIATLICYEQLLVWPILQSMARSPEVIVLIGNGWWTAGTNIVAIQRASAGAWSRLFAVPLVTSFNT